MDLGLDAELANLLSESEESEGGPSPSRQVWQSRVRILVYDSLHQAI